MICTVEFYDRPEILRPGQKRRARPEEVNINNIARFAQTIQNGRPQPTNDHSCPARSRLRALQDLRRDRIPRCRARAHCAPAPQIRPPDCPAGECLLRLCKPYHTRAHRSEYRRPYRGADHDTPGCPARTAQRARARDSSPTKGCAGGADEGGGWGGIGEVEG